jgi:hypothetical protein
MGLWAGVVLAAAAAAAEPEEAGLSEEVRELVAAASNVTDVADWIQKSVALEGRLVQNRNKLDTTLRAAMTRERMYRERELKQDEKVRRQRERIARLEAEMEAMIEERHPALAEMKAARAEIVRQHRQVGDDLAALRGVRVRLAMKADKRSASP